VAISSLDLSPPAALRVHVAHTPAGQPPAAPRLPLAFEPFLFLTPAHQALQQHDCPTLAFFLEDEQVQRTVAHFYVVLDFEGLGLACSPGQASFGGVQLAPGLPASALHTLLEAAEVALGQHHQTRLEIRSYASCYDPAGAATLAVALGERGYQVVLSEENYHLDLARDYSTQLDPAERRYLRKGKQAGFVVEQEPPYLLPAAYEFIAKCRHERGYKLSLSLERVQALFKAFPRQHLLLSVREPTGDWAAVLIAIRASSQVFYSFYLASPLRLNKLSPAVMLLGGLHAFAKANEAALVDMGTSTLPDGRPNQPLLDFKRYLGGIASPRLTWQKML
jgi:hypothetical protein